MPPTGPCSTSTWVARWSIRWPTPWPTEGCRSSSSPATVATSCPSVTTTARSWPSPSSPGSWCASSSAWCARPADGRHRPRPGSRGCGTGVRWGNSARPSLLRGSRPFMPDSPRVALFVTCLVDLFRPSVGFAAVKLLEQAGCRVEVPSRQTCCGQPAFNSGDRRGAEAIARGLIQELAGFDYVVAPSGSCAGMLRLHLPELFDDDPAAKERAAELAGRCHELVSFLVDVMGVREIAAQFDGSVTYHDSCSGLRELKVKRQPRELLAGVEGLSLREMEESEVCCGFGGTFCVKYPEISTRMVTNKAEHI